MQHSTSSSWMTSNNSNLMTNNSNFWSNGGFRKRKAAATDLEEKTNQKMFVTEEKMVKDMQTLSLELEALNNNTNNIPSLSPPHIEEEYFIDEIKSDQSDEEDHEKETYLEMHKLLKDSLKKDDLQDSLISKLCDIERRKLTMQIVPYMPIHPAQLNNDNVTTITDEKIKDKEETVEDSILDESKNDNDDYPFKIPSIPTPYTVEEPCETAIKRGPTMKRSYSQSDQYNSSLSVTELKPDGNDYSSVHPFQSAYFIIEPTITSLSHTSSTTSSSLSSGGPSVRITEFIENPTLNNEFINTLDDDDIDMQSVASSDTGDKMDDD